MVTVPFPAFEPDKNRYNANALPVALNVIPKADGYGPLKGPVTVEMVYFYLTDENGNRLTDENGNLLIVGGMIVEYLTDDYGNRLTDENDGSFIVNELGGAGIVGEATLPSACLGFFAARKADGTEALFAGTATGLYLFDLNSFTWQDVSGSSAPYASVDRWSAVKFGSLVLAQNGSDPEQMFDIESDAVFSDNATAPISKVIALVGDFVFRGNISSWDGHLASSQPNMIQWSAINNPLDNEPQNFNMSDFQSMPTGDEVMGIVPVSGGCHVWMRSALHMMSYALTSEYVFTRSPLDEMRGTSAPYSIGIIGQDDYVIYCDDGFWRYRGGSFTPIGHERINDWFLSVSNQDERENILACPDPENSVVWFAYTDTSNTRQMLGYRYNTDKWTTSDVQVAASTRARTFLYSASTPPIVQRDLLRFAFVDTDGYLSYLIGNNLAARVTTNEVQFANNRSFVNEVSLNGDPQDFTVTVSTTDVRGGAFRTRSPASPSSRSGMVPLRADGRTHKFQLDIPAEEDWETVSSIEVPAIRSGKS